MSSPYHHQPIREDTVTDTTDTKTPPSFEVIGEAIKDEFNKMLNEGRPEGGQSYVDARLRRFEAEVGNKLGIQVRVTEGDHGFVFDVRLNPTAEHVNIDFKIEPSDDRPDKSEAESVLAVAVEQVALWHLKEAKVADGAADLLCATEQHMAEIAQRTLSAFHRQAAGMIIEELA